MNLPADLTREEADELDRRTALAAAERRVHYLPLGPRGGIVIYPDGQQRHVSRAEARMVLAYARRQNRREGGNEPRRGRKGDAVTSP